MSRPLIILLVVLLAIVGLVIFLGTADTSVAPTRVEKAMLNEAAQ